MMPSDTDSNSSPMSYSDMYNDDAYVIEDDETNTTADQAANNIINNNKKKKSPNVDYGFDDEDALDFGGVGASYNIPYMMHDHSSVATGTTTTTTGQDRVSTSSSVTSVPSLDQGRKNPSSLLGASDDNSVVSAAPSVDSYGYSAVGSVAGSGSAAAAASATLPPPLPTQIRSTAIPTPYHNNNYNNTAASSLAGSMSTNPYYSYDSVDGSTEVDDAASVEMSLVTPEPQTPGRKNPFGNNSNSTLQDSVKIQFVPAPPPVVSKTARQSSSTTEYPDNPEDEFGVSTVVSSLQDDFSAQSSVKVAYVPSPFAQDGTTKSQGQNNIMAPTSPLTPVFPEYQQHQQKTLPANAPMAPLPPGGQMINPSIPRPDSDDNNDGDLLQVNHHSEYPTHPFHNQQLYDYNSESSLMSEPSDQQQYHDEYLEKNQKKTNRQPSGSKSVSSSVATEKPKKNHQQQTTTTTRANPFTIEDPEEAIPLKGQDETTKPKKEKKKMSCCRKCLCIFIPALLLILGGGGYYAYTRDFFGFDFFGLYDSSSSSKDGASQGTNPQDPQDKPGNDPEENNNGGGSISFPNSQTPTAAPFASEPPKGIINDGENNNNNNNNNSTTDDDPSIGVIGTHHPHLTPVDTKPPTQSPSMPSVGTSMPSAATAMPSVVTAVPEPTAAPSIFIDEETTTTTAPTTKAESEIMIQYRKTMTSFLQTRGISFDTTESTTTVNAMDRLMNDVVAAKFQDVEPVDPFYEDIYRVTQRFALYCLGIALEETAQEDYVTVLELGEPWTPQSEPAPMHQLVFERMDGGETTKSADHCNWPGVICSNGDYREIISITWNQQGLDGTIPSEISLLRSLTSMDLANNYIHGTIPSQLYELANLERLVLNHNYLEGKLALESASEKLTHLDLGQNLLSGNLESLQSAQQLQYLNLNQNTLTGSIPDTLQLPTIDYFDVGHNLLTGPLPTALPKSATQIRHMRLEFNGFSGNLPIEYLWAGKWRLLTLKVNNNQLTGAVPAGGSNNLVQFTLQNNQFTQPLDQQTCDLDQTLGLGGSVIEFGADCTICKCTGGVFCNSCNV